jgi:hypothetical protein
MAQAETKMTGMNREMARGFAIYQICLIEKPTAARVAQLHQMSGLELTNVYFRHFNYDWQEHIDV